MHVYNDYSPTQKDLILSWVRSAFKALGMEGVLKDDAPTGTSKTLWMYYRVSSKKYDFCISYTVLASQILMNAYIYNGTIADVNKRTVQVAITEQSIKSAIEWVYTLNQQANVLP